MVDGTSIAYAFVLDQIVGAAASFCCRCCFLPCAEKQTFISLQFLHQFLTMFAISFIVLFFVCVVAIPGVFSTTKIFQASLVSKITAEDTNTKTDDVTTLNGRRPLSRNKLTHLLAVVPRRVRTCNFENAVKTVEPATNQNNNRFSRLL